MMEHPIVAEGLTEDELRRLETSFIQVVRWVMSSAHRMNGSIDRAGYVTLVVLEEETVRLSDLATRLSLDSSTVSRQIKNLEDQGFVRRTDDPDDRRASVLTLTDAGADELRSQRASRWAPVSNAVSSMSRERRRKVLQLLDDLAEACRAETPGKATR